MRRAVVTFLAVAVAACAARKSDPIVGPPALGPKEQRGEIAFMRACNGCHPGGEGGIGGSLMKPLPGFGIKTKVRTGAGGDMPRFNAQELPDEDLDAIVDYLAAKRKND
jgi:mono/diheme cytochrome c family protein